MDDTGQNGITDQSSDVRETHVAMHHTNVDNINHTVSSEKSEDFSQPNIGFELQGNHPEKLEESKESTSSDSLDVENAYAYSENVISDPHKPQKLVPFRTRCIADSCFKSAFLPNSKIYNWLCKNCRRDLQFDREKYVYCSCGKFYIPYLRFKCNDPEHGVEFLPPPQSVSLLGILGEIKSFEELNILVLGETGVGKSTWINSFKNLLSYSSLKEAEENPLYTLIPSQFTLQNENYEEFQVSTGSDDNEITDVGQSGTQSTKVYRFYDKDKVINLFDTPGVGDVRGLEVDNRNFQNILSTLSNIEYLHGICILLKPTNSRLTVMFKFCIKELLTYLHRDAKDNIVFCFTNTRGSSYQPGDTLPTLRKLLSENPQTHVCIVKDRVYCFDNEAYRYLAAKKTHTRRKFSDTDKANYKKSWDKSYVETRRLLDYIQNLKPHPVKSTINLNYARELVVKLTRPLADVSRLIQYNREKCTAEKKEIEATENNLEELGKRRIFKRTEIVTKPLKHARYVCAHANCILILPQLRENSIIYKTVCHDDCGSKHAKLGYFGDWKWWRCSIISIFGKCKKCGHAYNDHMHINYESILTTKDVEDEEVINSISSKTDAKTMKENMINARNLEISQYEDELKMLESASVKFAVFLRSNAITPFNDEMESYLDYLIREEELKRAAGGSTEILENLRRSKESYLAKKQILQDEIKRVGESAPSISKLEDIENTVEELKALKHSGKALQDAISCIDFAQRIVFEKRVQVVHTYSLAQFETIIRSDSIIFS